jgi:hypothetical protein
MSCIEPPAGLSRSERKTFRKLVQMLAERGIEPGARAHLVADFVLSDRRLADLRRHENQTNPASNLAVIRAVNTATAERRRLHAAMFKGARKPAPAPAKEKVRASDSAIEAWQRYVLQYGWGKVEPCYSRVIAAHGDMPWEVLLDFKLADSKSSGMPDARSSVAVKESRPSATERDVNRVD